VGDGSVRGEFIEDFITNLSAFLYLGEGLWLFGF
jgi:hypothetical protein